ncbi:MAG: hypothetical protein J7L07_02080 [Candidatus Odinarchaeota archaeon]|nr:hypothetical protein [Candidatus Odinarchaeota archaeon]
MINEIFIVDKKSENLFYHFRLPESKFQLTEVHATQFVATIAKISEILSPDKTEKIQYLRTTSFKILFEVIDDFVFMLVADSEDDDLELNYLLATIVNRALPLLKENRVRFLNINDLMFRGRVKLSDKQALPKLIILRFGDVHKALIKLKNEIDALTSMRSYDTSSIMMISTMVEPIEKTLDDVKNALKELPYMP